LGGIWYPFYSPYNGKEEIDGKGKFSLREKKKGTKEREEEWEKVEEGEEGKKFFIHFMCVIL
jgi:hypothetical protein